MKRVPIVIIAGVVLASAGIAPAELAAQVKPAMSGKLSHNAPQMRRHGSGLHRPNRPHFHHHHGHHGYRPVHGHHHHHHPGLD